MGSFKTVTRHATTYDDNDHGSFPLPFPGDFYQERLWVSEDGLTAVLGVLCADDYAIGMDPLENGNEGEFVQFDHGYKYDADRPDLETWKRIIRDNPGRVFAHNGTGDWHGPGTTKCYVIAGPLTAADTRGKRGTHGEECPAADVLDEMGGYYIVPEDATDPAQYAASTLESYSMWCNGEVYGVCVWTFTRATDSDEWELNEDDRNECWGFIGSEYAAEELESQFKGEVTRHES